MTNLLTQQTKLIEEQVRIQRGNAQTLYIKSEDFQLLSPTRQANLRNQTLENLLLSPG